MRITDLHEFLTETLTIHNNIAVSGSTGIGKSEILYQVAKELNMSVLEVRLYEQGESCAGLPMIRSELTQFTKPFWWDELTRGQYDILFLDDFHLVVPGLQKFLYKILTHRQLHNYKAHDFKLVIAGNFNIESAEASEIPSPIMSRIEVWGDYKPSTRNFLRWAGRSSRIDFRVCSYLMINEGALYTEDPPVTKKFPCPRTWEMLSKNLKVTQSPKYAPSIIGVEEGTRFIDFWKFLSTPLEEILASEPSNQNEKVRSATALVSYSKPSAAKTMKRILKFVDEKLDPESQFLYCKGVYDLHEKQRNIFLKLLQNESPQLVQNLNVLFTSLVEEPEESEVEKSESEDEIVG